MLARVVVENGVKKLVPLTADTGAGNPVGTVIAVYSNQVPNGYLPCNGVAFDTAQFPVLYALLGDDHTPDLRECTLVGVGRSGRTMGAHDEYTLGQFKDDQSQKITGRYNATGSFGSNEGAFVQTSAFEYANGVARSGTQWSSVNFDSSGSVRTGTTTHGKQVGVNWCIKASSGLTENAQDNVLNILQPVDTVAVDNMHSVTSNAVAQALLLKAGIETGSFSLNFLRSTVQTVSGSYVKIGSVVFANVRVNVTATTAGNDYVNLPSNVPAMDALKGCFGSWRTEEYNGYGTIQNSGTNSIWFIYNNEEYNVGQKAINGGGSLQIELMYFT